MKLFSVFFLFFQVLILISSSLACATEKPQFVRGEKVLYLTHGGALREATIVEVVYESPQSSYRIICDLVQVLVSETSLRKIPETQIVHANPRRWDLSRRVRLPILAPIPKKSKNTQAS